MKATYINYRDTHSFSPAVVSYLENDPNLVPFIAHPPTLEGLKNLLSEKKVTANRQLLAEVLREQYGRSASLKLNSRLSENFTLLENSQTYTITTGHQLNIFTGPLYFIYKIITAVKLAADLKLAFPEFNFVPVYWMATEDHDFAEINHTLVNGKKIEWPLVAAGATGKRSTQSIAPVVNAYREALGISDNAEMLANMVSDAYLNNGTLADATRAVVHALFGKYGLVVVDADDSRLKRQFAEIITRDIIQQNSFREINETSDLLAKAGVETQVNAREINFFYMTEGSRERITFEDGVYFVLHTGIRFTEQELRAEIEEHPERFSPNVVMRPLYQEVILPNLAYIGGGAEVVYWLQLKKNFKFYGIDFPVLILRNSALIASENTQTRLNRLELSFKDLFTRADKLKTNWVLKHSGNKISLSNEWEQLTVLLDALKTRTMQVDNTLGPSTEAVRARLHKQILNLEKKLLKAEKRNHESSLSAIDQLRSKLFPGEALQERSENVGSFFVKYGPALLDELLENFKPLDFKFTILF